MAYLEGWPGEKSLLSKKNIAARLKFAKVHLNKSQDFQNNIFWTDKTKVEMGALSFSQDSIYKVIHCIVFMTLAVREQNRFLILRCKYLYLCC